MKKLDQCRGAWSITLLRNLQRQLIDYLTWFFAFSFRKCKVHQKRNLRRKRAIGERNEQTSLQHSGLQKKPSAIWRQEERFPICHLRPLATRQIIFNVPTVQGDLMRALQKDIFLNAKILYLTKDVDIVLQKTSNYKNHNNKNSLTKNIFVKSLSLILIMSLFRTGWKTYHPKEDFAKEKQISNAIFHAALIRLVKLSRKVLKGLWSVSLQTDFSITTFPKFWPKEILDIVILLAKKWRLLNIKPWWRKYVGFFLMLY